MSQVSQTGTENVSFTSEVFDGEERLDDKSIHGIVPEKFTNYAIIGDAMRSQHSNEINIDITAKVAAALENEPTYTEHQVAKTTQNNVVAISNWRKPLSQIAIAASVSLFAIIGINSTSLITHDVAPIDGPVLQSQPLAGFVSPVSLFSEQPALKSAEQGIKDLQQKRIGALFLEHQRQSRMAYALANKESEKTLMNEKGNN